MPIKLFNLIYPKMKLELKEVYVNRVLRALGFSFISVFIPIYLLNLGFPLNTVFLYMFFEFFFLGIFAYPAALLESKLGVKRTLSAGTFFSIIFFLMLFTIETINWSLPFLGFVNGFAHALFWVPFNANFVKNADKECYGKEIGMLDALPYLMGVTGPILGAFIITYFSFDIALIFACLILVFSIIPFFLTRDVKPKLKKMENIFHGRYWNYFDLYVIKGLMSIVVVTWPIFVFYFAADYITIGIIDSIKGVAAAIFTFVIGMMCDKIKLGHVFKIAGAINVLVWALIFLTSSSPHFFILSFLIGFAYIFLVVPTFVLSTMVSQENPTEFMVFREIAFLVGRCSLLAFMIFLPFQDKFVIPFLLAAIVSTYLLIFRTRKVKF